MITLICFYLGFVASYALNLPPNALHKRSKDHWIEFEGLFNSVVNSNQDTIRANFRSVYMPNYSAEEWKKFIASYNNALETAVQEKSSNKHDNKRNRALYFVLPMGPPASGKTVMLPEIYKTLGISSQRKTIINVDTIMGSLKKYKQDSEKLINDISKHQLAGMALSASFDSQFCTTSNDIYYASRPLADLISNLMLLESLIARDSHIFYETTGGSDSAFEWASDISKLSISRGYSSVVAYPVTDLETLIERAQIRARVTGRWPCRAVIENYMIKAQANLFNAINMMKMRNSAFDRIIVYDGTTFKKDLDVDVLGNFYQSESFT